MLRQLISYPKNFFRSLDLRSQISKRIMWIISKSHREKFFFFIFLQFIHQVDMKNIVECQKEFFAYFNALETYGETSKSVLLVKTKKFVKGTHVRYCFYQSGKATKHYIICFISLHIETFPREHRGSNRFRIIFLKRSTQSLVF